MAVHFSVPKKLINPKVEADALKLAKRIASIRFGDDLSPRDDQPQILERDGSLIYVHPATNNHWLIPPGQRSALEDKWMLVGRYDDDNALSLIVKCLERFGFPEKESRSAADFELCPLEECKVYLDILLPHFNPKKCLDVMYLANRVAAIRLGTSHLDFPPTYHVNVGIVDTHPKTKDLWLILPGKKGTPKDKWRLVSRSGDEESVKLIVKCLVLFF